MSSKGKPSCRCQQLGYQTVKKSLAEFAAKAANKVESFSAAACTWTKTHLRLQVWNLFANREQIMRAADCKTWRKRPKDFFDKRKDHCEKQWSFDCFKGGIQNPGGYPAWDGRSRHIWMPEFLP